MDDLYNYRFNCVNVSAGNNQYIEEWVTNETTTRIIEIAINPMYPHSIFAQLNSSSYQWCGPVILIAKKFAEISKLR